MQSALQPLGSVWFTLRLVSILDSAKACILTSWGACSFLLSFIMDCIREAVFFAQSLLHMCSEEGVIPSRFLLPFPLQV